MKYLLATLAILALSSCSDKSDVDPSTTNSLDAPGGTAYQIIPRNIELANQTLTVVPHSEFLEWVNNHKTAHIHSISSIDRGAHGMTNGHIIVWSNTVTTVEKSPKELALEKLTDADKKALGLKP